jgi:hypothetical protein
MADNILEIQARADFSALFGESQAAAASIEDSSKRIKTAMESAGDAPKKIQYSIMEARHAASGFGEEIGIRIPRVLGSFLAQSSTIGPILASAFSVVAIGMFVQVLAQVPEAIDKIIAKFTGWDDAARKTYNDIISDNNRLLMKNVELADKQEALNLIGITGSQKYAREILNVVDSQERWGKLGEVLAQKAADLNRQLDAIKNNAAATVRGPAFLYNWITGMDKDAKALEEQLKAVTKAQEEVAEKGAEKGQQVPGLRKEEQIAVIHETMEAAKEAARLQREQTLAALNDEERAAKERTRLAKEEAKENEAANKEMEHAAEEAAKATEKAWEKAWEAVVRAQDKANKEAERAKKKLQHEFDEMFRPMNRAMDQMVDGLLRGNLRIGAAFRELGISMLTPILTTFEKAIEAQIEYNLTAGAIGKEHALAEIMRDAYKAAARIYGEVPFPLNIPAAAAMFATVMGLGAGLPSAAGGWDVPSTGGFALLHPKEMVLPSHLAENVRQGGGGGVHLHVHAVDARGLDAWFDQNQDRLTRTLQRGMRKRNAF